MKDFVSAAKAQAIELDTVTFKIDGEEVTMRRPTEDQMVMIMAAEGSDIRTTSNRIATYIDFAVALMDDDSKRYVQAKLFDGDDPFGYEDLIEIIREVIEEFSNRPTKPFSGSTTSSENGGASSTETVSAEESTSSPSLQLMPTT